LFLKLLSDKVGRPTGLFLHSERLGGYHDITLEEGGKVRGYPVRLPTVLKIET